MNAEEMLRVRIQ